MATNEEHGAQNPNNPYCIHCTDMKGKLLPFERKFEDMVKSAMDTRWMNREQAVSTGAQIPNSMPFCTLTVLLTVAPFAMVTVMLVTGI